MSALTWLSASSAEINRARDVLKALTPGGVIDELGFLVLASAFADRFYPAVTTPMTRARYFIFVAAIYQYLERSGKAVGRDVERLAGDLQYELLKRVRSERGAIGKEAERNIQRPPSEIYWSAIAVLGLATQRLSLGSYQRRLSDGLFRPRTLRDDDHAVHPEEMQSLWDPALPLSHVFPDGVFPEDTTLRLRKDEALLLRDRHAALKTDGHDTLITHMVTLARERGLTSLDGLSHPWDIPGLPVHTRDVVDHARRLSLFARGTTLQYYRMILEKKREQDTGAREAFVAWWEAAHVDLARWDQDDFFAIVHGWDADKRPLHDRVFFKQWIMRCAAAQSGEDALHDPQARAIIAERERRIRPGKERLKVKYQLDAWKPMSNYGVGELYQLSYRHPVGRTFAQDIADGLERGAS